MEHTRKNIHKENGLSIMNFTVNRGGGGAPMSLLPAHFICKSVSIVQCIYLKTILYEGKDYHKSYAGIRLEITSKLFKSSPCYLLLQVNSFKTNRGCISKSPGELNMQTNNTSLYHDIDFV